MTGLIHDIEVDRDWVDIGPATVERPNYVAISEWLDFWSAVRQLNEDFLDE